MLNFQILYIENLAVLSFLFWCKVTIFDGKFYKKKSLGVKEVLKTNKQVYKIKHTICLTYLEFKLRMLILIYRKLYELLKFFKRIINQISIIYNHISKLMIHIKTIKIIFGVYQAY